VKHVIKWSMSSSGTVRVPASSLNVQKGCDSQKEEYDPHRGLWPWLAVVAIILAVSHNVAI